MDLHKFLSNNSDDVNNSKAGIASQKPYFSSLQNNNNNHSNSFGFLGKYSNNNEKKKISIEDEINSIKKDFNSINSKLDEQNNYIKKMNETLNLFISNISNLVELKDKPKSKVYIACKLHQHLLLEVNLNDMNGLYCNGFVCNNCNYQQKNIDEKFYHCSCCNSNPGYNVCQNCIKTSLL